MTLSVWRTIFVLGGAGLALAGCVATTLSERFGAPRGPLLAAAKLPEYIVGDRFRYDDGRVEAVTDADRGKVSWRNDRDFVFITSRSPFAPRLGWRSAGKISELSVTKGVPEAIWPLRVGSKMEIAYSNSVRGRDSGYNRNYRQRWTCEVTRTQSVTVPAGEFDTYRVDCPRRDGEGRRLGRRTWFYAPEIGHYVKRIDRYAYGKGDQVRELIGVELSLLKLSKAARRGLAKVRETALRTRLSGETASWHSADGRTSISITPLRTYRTEKGIYCRDYRETRQTEGRRGSFSATACLLEKRGWVRI